MLPNNALEVMDWPWVKFQPYYQELTEQPLGPANLESWLADWSHLSQLVYETYQRLYVAITVDTTDKDAEQRYNTFLDEIFPAAQAAEQPLKEKLIASGLEPPGFEMPLRNMRAEADLFRPANLPLLSEEFKLSAVYDKIIGAQTVDWEGQEVTITQLQPVFLDADRSRRERAWRLAAARQLADRQAINDLWVKLLQLRGEIAANAGKPDYRAYKWQQQLRFDYTPQDCQNFHRAIEEVVVPATRAHLRPAAARPGRADSAPLGPGGRPCGSLPA